MNIPKLNRLRDLRNAYDHALTICDPVDYSVRHRDLIYALVEYLIYPLQEHEHAERHAFNPLIKEDHEDQSD